MIKKEEKKPQHLILFDIDGTTTGINGFDDFETLNPKIKKIIEKLISDGHKVCFSSGRNFLSAMIIHKEAELDGYISAYNGALIVNPTKKSEPIGLFVSNQIIKKILQEQIIKDNIINVYMDRDDLVILTTSKEPHYQKLFLRENPYFFCSDPHDILKLLGEKDVFQAIIEFKNDPLIKDKIFQTLEKYNNSVFFYEEKKLISDNEGKILVPDSTKTTIRIRNKNSSKAWAAKVISSLYNIPLENTVAFGNAVNDIEVIEVVGKGIVTADSIDYLKALAYDTLKRDYNLNSDAVAYYLAEYFGYEL